ncbi:Altered inheritance of mitochondria protein 6 [Teratosphaeriaceae sp. CCFEE 6253]|nr:Altered inheritance of mitochondria protein 6 [Teratosphaeriaceae sp. CCFEE 6253]
MATPPLPGKVAPSGTPPPDATGDDERSGSGDCEEDVEDGEHASDLTTRLSIARRLLLAFGMTSRRRKGGHDYEPASKESDGLLKRSPTPESPRGRRTSVWGVLKRALLAMPFVVLMIFGLLHILHATIGRARLLWDVDAQDNFLPHWGKPGHAGADVSSYPTDATRDVLPIPCHSHNDYWRRIPLFDALHWGCTGVEADVWLFDDELYVGHNLAALARNRTFESLYINPIVDLLEKMNPNTDFVNATGHGVFDVDPNQTLVLLVDFKTEGREIFDVVSRQLEPLREKGYLSFWDGESVQSRAVTVVATGKAPADLIVNDDAYRDIFYDAPLGQLWEKPRTQTQLDESLDRDGPAETTPSPERNTTTTPTDPRDAFHAANSYYASTSFTSAVGFVWHGHLSPRQMDILRGQIRGAHRRGLRARYWDTPGWPVAVRDHVWHVLMKEGADVLNVDDLRAAAVDQWQARTHQWW